MAQNTTAKNAIVASGNSPFRRLIASILSGAGKPPAQVMQVEDIESLLSAVGGLTSLVVIDDTIREGTGINLLDVVEKIRRLYDGLPLYLMQSDLTTSQYSVEAAKAAGATGYIGRSGNLPGELKTLAATYLKA